MKSQSKIFITYNTEILAKYIFQKILQVFKITRKIQNLFMKPALSLISKVIPEMDRQSSRKPWPSATRGKHDCTRREVNRNTQLVLGSKANSWDITRWTLIFSYFASQISAIQAERTETKYSKMWKQESALPKNILSLDLLIYQANTDRAPTTVHSWTQQ